MKPHEIPVRLLEQKKTWDLEAFYEIAMQNPSWWCFLVGDDGDEEPFGALILSDNPLYDEVDGHTVIVDKAVRTPERAEATIRLGLAMTKEIARQLGRKYMGASVRDPDRFIAQLGDSEFQVVESVIRREIEWDG